jgi:hypothetical protein
MQKQGKALPQVWKWRSLCSLWSSIARNDKKKTVKEHFFYLNFATIFLLGQLCFTPWVHEGIRNFAHPQCTYTHSHPLQNFGLTWLGYKIGQEKEKEKEKGLGVRWYVYL